MNAAVRCGLADRFLVRRAMDVNVARMRIHAAAAIETGFETFEPQDARGDFGVRKFRLRRVADDLARFENRSRPLARSDFFRDVMQSERRAVRAFRLPDAITRSGTGNFFCEFASLKKRNGLFGNVDSENELRRSNFIFLTGTNKITAEARRRIDCRLTVHICTNFHLNVSPV